MTRPATPAPTPPPREQPRAADVPTPRALRPSARPGDSGFSGQRTVQIGDSAAQRTRVTPAPPDPRDQEGQPFGRYRLLQELGKGGMGVVWKAWDTQLRRVVALKQVITDPLFADLPIDRFVREAQIAGKLRHPAIVQVHDVGVQDGQHYFTQDYVEGTTLGARAQQGVSCDQALDWVVAIAEALQYAHDQGVVHRDVKPDNILLDGADRPYITDFGLAKEVDLGGSAAASHLTLSGALVGTPRYMSPEQAAGHRGLGPASDQFSLAVVLFELLTGKLPFTGESLRDQLNAIAEAEPARPSSLHPDLAPDLDTVVARALDKDPQRRYPSVGELGRDLARVRAGEPIQARAASLAIRFRRAMSRHRRWAGVALAVAGVLLAGCVFLLWRMSARMAEAERTRALAERNRAEALRLLEEGRPALEKATRSLYRAGGDFAELARQVDAAADRFSQAIKLEPDLVLAHYLLGQAWELRGYEEKAEACWRDAIARDPGFGPARFRLGKSLLLRAYLTGLGAAESGLELERRKSAAAPLADQADRELALAFSGAPPAGFEAELRAGRELGRALQALIRGREREVRELCDQALARAPDEEGSEELYVVRGAVEDDPAKALAGFEHALAIRPKYALARFLRGGVRMMQGDLAGACREYDAALAVNPRLVPALHNRGLLRQHAQEWTGALADYDAALAVDPRYFRSLVHRGSVRKSLGYYDGALADFDAALAIDPEVAATWNNRAGLRWARGEIEAALADWEAALRCDPRQLEAIANRGNAFLELGEPGRALTDFEQADRIAPPGSPIGPELRRRAGWARENEAALAEGSPPRWLGWALGAAVAWRLQDFEIARVRYEAVLAEQPDPAGHPGLTGALREAHYFLTAMSAQRSDGNWPPGVQSKPPDAAAATAARDRGFAHLRAALELDAPGARRAFQDPDLAPLQSDPRWAELREKFGKD